MRHKNSRHHKSSINAFIGAIAYMLAIPYLADWLNNEFFSHFSSHPMSLGTGTGYILNQMRHLKTTCQHLLHKNPRKSGDSEPLKEEKALANELSNRSMQTSHRFFKVSHTSGKTHSDVSRRPESRTRDDSDFRLIQ